MTDQDSEFHFRANADGRFEVQISGVTAAIRAPAGPLHMKGDEAVNAFREFAGGWLDGHNERRRGSFAWARLQHAKGVTLHSDSTGASMSRLLAWKELVLPVVALEAEDWRVV